MRSLFSKALDRLNHTQVSLDIGSSNVKLVVLRRPFGGRGKYKLIAIDQVAVPPDTIRDGRIINSDVLTQLIRGLVDKHNLRGTKTIISCSSCDTIVKRVSLSEMTLDALQRSIHWEAEQYIPFDIDSVNVDFQILDPKVGDGQMHVLLVAIRKEVVNQYAEATRKAGLNPIVVDSNICSLCNQYALNYGVNPEDETVCLINLGASTCDLILIAHGQPVFERGITMGGNFLTYEISKYFAVSWDDAEQMKINSTRDTSDVLEEVRQVSKKVNALLVEEIRRYLNFYDSTTFTNTGISCLYYTGGATRQYGFPELLGSALGVKVERLNPFRNIEIGNGFDPNTLESSRDTHAIAVALATRRHGDSLCGGMPVHINLTAPLHPPFALPSLSAFRRSLRSGRRDFMVAGYTVELSWRRGK